MDVLTEQAHTALDALRDRFPDAQPDTIARIMWLEGYKAGMDAVQTLADESFAKLQAKFS